MDLSTRDAYVVAQLAKFTAQGMTTRQAVLEVMRTAGFINIALTGHDQAALDDDVSGLQTAVADLKLDGNRAVATAVVGSGTQLTNVLPSGFDKKTMHRARVIASGN